MPQARYPIWIFISIILPSSERMTRPAEGRSRAGARLLRRPANHIAG
jgi:hypothetical protein